MAEQLSPQQLIQLQATYNDPQAGLKLQQQQALASMMMQEGSQQQDPNAMVSGHVVPVSPLGSVAKLAQLLGGAYMQSNNNDKLAEMIKAQSQPQQQPAQVIPSSGAATVGADGSLIGDAPPPQQAQQLGQQMSGQPQNNGGVNGLLPAGMNPLQASYIGQFSPEVQKASLDHLIQTNEQKNISDPRLASGIKGKMAAEGLVNVNGHMMPASQLIGNGQPNMVSNAPHGNPAITPQSISGQAALSDLYGAQPSGRAVDIKSPTGNNVDYNNPLDMDQRKGLIAGDQKYLNETLLPAKDAATAANNNLSALTNAAAIANSKDLTRTGPTDSSRVNFAKHLNDFLSSTGGTPIDQNELANADSINKIGLRLTANMTKELGSREAAQIFTKIQEANPNWYMQPKTLTLVTNLIKGENDTAIGKYNAGYKAARSGGFAQDGVNSYDAQNPGLANVKKAYAAAGMQGFDSVDDPQYKALAPNSKFYDLNPQSPTYGRQGTKK
jgi:hypothetical protein